MRVYEAIFDKNKKGVYALSVVENPAMEDHWIALAEQKQVIELAQVDQDKRLLLGAALIPNKKILRSVDGNQFYITFKEETIEKLSHSFFKNGNQNNSSLEHKIALEGMSVVESWTVQDPNNDKSNAFGKTYEKGTWVTMMKVDNDEVWKKAKNGEIKGFSIDALLGLQEIKLNTNTMSETVELKKSITEAIADGFKALFNKKEEEEKTKEEIALELAAAEEAKELALKAEKDNVDETVKEAIAEFSTQVEVKIETIKTEFSKQLEDKDKVIEELKAELAKVPEVKEIKANPSVSEVSYDKMTNAEKMEFNKSNK